MRAFHLLLALLIFAACGATSAAQPQAPSDYRTLGREVLKELIETDTTTAHGRVSSASEKLAKRFLAAGFSSEDVQLVGANPDKQNLVVRLHGQGKRKPMLFIGHLDVVEARREDWTSDPFALIEKDGYFYGRGTLDMKGGDAGFVVGLLRMKLEGVVPRGDYILALTAGEEDGLDNGIEWLLANRRDLIDAELAINHDAGGGEIHNGRRTHVSVQTAEKVFLSFTVTARNKGGHSSIPRADNAIFELAAALDRLGKFQFPLRSSPTTRFYFERLAALSDPAVAADMKAAADPAASQEQLARLAAHSDFYNALLRTTCVPTLLEGGHAENALPQMARATINCRMLPDEKPQAVEAALNAALADPAIVLARVAEPKPSPASPINDKLFKAIARAGKPVYGEFPVVPYLQTGASDGLYLRAAGMPVYGFNGIFYDVDDDRSHGRDERILVQSFYESLEFDYQLLKAW